MASLLTALIQKLRRSNAAGELPIREELYSVERLEQYAAALAARHTLAGKPRRLNLLLPRLEENGRKLLAAYKALAESIREDGLEIVGEQFARPRLRGLLQAVDELKRQVGRLRHLLNGMPMQLLPQVAGVRIAVEQHTLSPEQHAR